MKLGSQGSHRLEKYLNIEGFMKFLKIKSALKSTGNPSKALKAWILLFTVGLNTVKG